MGKSSNKQTFKSVDVQYSVTKTSGYILDGVITHREGEPAVGPIVIFVHGTLSSARHNFTDELTQKISNELGFRSYRFNLRFDKSEFEPNHRYKFSGYDDDIDDLSAVIDALKQDGFMPWCLFGHSRGANDVLLYASRYGDKEMVDGVSDDEVNFHRKICFDKNSLAVIAAAPRFNMKNMSKTIFTNEQLSLLDAHGSCPWHTQKGELTVLEEDLKITDCYMNMDKVIDTMAPEIPMLLLHGSEDELIPVEDARLYKERRSSIDLTIIEGARHAFRGKKQNKILLSTVTHFASAYYTLLTADMPKHWFPLESNPAVMNAYAEKMGLDTSKFSFNDVLSTEDWALSMVPRPVVGVIMLFPIKKVSEDHSCEERERILRDGQFVSPSIYYMKQTIGNACGTVGILHSIANARDHVQLKPSSYLERLYATTENMSPEEKAAYLEADEEIEETHTSAAEEGQSDQAVGEVDTHFICFSHIDGQLYELDGRKLFPINHGISSSETLLEDACKVIQGFMERDAGEIKFTIVALCRTADEE